LQRRGDYDDNRFLVWLIGFVVGIIFAVFVAARSFSS